jgi:hypothetical protein
MESRMPSRTPKHLLAAALALAAWQPAAFAGSGPAEQFDQHVAPGLPQAFSLTRPADDERGTGVDQVVIQERLDTDVIYPDGRHATTYTGTANGVEATFTRLGNTLTLSVFDEPAESAAATHRIRRSTPETDDVIRAPAIGPSSLPRLDDAVQASELQFWIFLHDEAGESNYGKFHGWYIAWWLRDMEKTVKPGLPVKVFIKDHVPGVTDFDYHKGSASQALLAFRNAADEYHYGFDRYGTGLRKNMLFVGERPANWEGDYGKAIQRDTVAMATGSGPRHGIAHEFGHTLDAVHEHGETRFPCVTNMKPYTPGLFSCKIYSGLNDERIREHVKQQMEREAYR